MNTHDQIHLSKSDELEAEPRDWTRFIWIGVVALLILMMASFYLTRSPRPLTTMVRARHILISFDPSDPVDRGRAYERISDLRERVVAGENFERLARDYSDDPGTARRGGDLGWMERGKYAPAFEEYCWVADIGQVSDIIQTQYGFHLIRVEDRYIASADLYEIELERKAFDLLRDDRDAGESSVIEGP